MATIRYGGNKFCGSKCLRIPTGSLEEGSRVQSGCSGFFCISSAFSFQSRHRAQCGLKCSSEFFRTSIPVCTHVLCMFTACRTTPAGVDSNLEDCFVSSVCTPVKLVFFLRVCLLTVCRVHGFPPKQCSVDHCQTAVTR